MSDQPRGRPAGGRIAGLDIDDIVADAAAQAARARRGLSAGEEFTVVTKLTEVDESLTPEQYDVLTERINREVAAFGVMLEALHDVKCDFVVFRDLPAS